MTQMEDWTIAGADDQPIYGNTHLPSTEPRGVMLVCHGFKGYKDYGFFPQLTETAAEHGLIAHRFNFSHSGMTNQIHTFERPDLFEKDTWGKQIFDLEQVTRAARTGQLPSREHEGKLPMIWFGHSRGGVSVLLTAARHPNAPPERLIAAATPHSASHLTDEMRRILLSQGFVESPSSRTGQQLRLGRTWLDEIEAAPDSFDPLKAIARIACPILLIHGETDETVPPESSRLFERAAERRARCVVVPGASHTFNAPNPLPLHQPPPSQTRNMIDTVIQFALD